MVLSKISRKSGEPKIARDGDTILAPVCRAEEGVPCFES